jgi:hypothetical protein
MNPAMAAMEIHMAREEIRRLCRELARTVLQKAIEKDGAVLPDGASGNQIRRAVGIMDAPVTKALQLGAAHEALELGGYTPSTSTDCSRMAERAEVARMLPIIQSS